jgi:hypothetical protein
VSANRLVTALGFPCWNASLLRFALFWERSNTAFLRCEQFVQFSNELAEPVRVSFILDLFTQPIHPLTFLGFHGR